MKLNLRIGRTVCGLCFKLCRACDFAKDDMNAAQKKGWYDKQTDAVPLKAVVQGRLQNQDIS